MRLGKRLHVEAGRFGGQDVLYSPSRQGAVPGCCGGVVGEPVGKRHALVPRPKPLGDAGYLKVLGDLLKPPLR
ncbi:hypothetical protein ABT173_48340, partial [Streptomyces sp. NPDC001795]|uniref:hypothetical protein n=1 Tax=Streptomyces sp. NPDC001795 TaxID=3154525 RepID=UPI003325D1FE